MTASGGDRPTHLRAGDPEAADVVVRIDGVARLDILEADSAEGWAEVIRRTAGGSPVITEGRVETERIHGNVEFWWRR